MRGATLFDAEPTEDTATAAQVRELVTLGYKESAVIEWTRDKAATVIARNKRDAKATERRASSAAILAGGDESERGQVSILEREIAARHLEWAIATGSPDELLIAVSVTPYVLMDEELRTEAARLLGIYRAE